MHASAALPPEILHNILQFALNKDPSLPCFLQTGDETQGLRDLYACCLVNRTWLVQSRPLLYSKFRHKSDEDSFTKLWHFLRTVLEKPKLGALVRHLDLRQVWPSTMMSKEEVDSREQRSRRQERRALLTSGAPVEISSLAKAIQSQERAPLIATLIASLPGVSKLYLSSDYVYENGGNLFGRPFLQVLEDRKSLQQFKDVMLLPSDPRIKNSLSMRGIDILFLQRSVRNLMLFDLNPCCMPALSDKFAPHTSNVTHLTITCGVNESSLPYANRRYSISAARSGLTTCLQLPRALVSLTLNIGYFVEWGFDVTWSHLISLEELWRILQHHAQTLQYLDLCDEDGKFIQFRGRQTREDTMGKLDKFGHLKTLRIQPRTLLGGNQGLPEVAYGLRDALPTSLRSLTLYDLQINAHTGGRDLVLELLQILDETTFADNLKYLLIEPAYNDYLGFPKQGEDIYERLEALRQACKDRDIVFYIKDGQELPQGGYNLRLFPEAYESESQL